MAIYDAGSKQGRIRLQGFRALENTFTTATANEAGMKEKAMVIIIAAENASRSYKVNMKRQITLTVYMIRI